MRVDDAAAHFQSEMKMELWYPDGTIAILEWEIFQCEADQSCKLLETAWDTSFEPALGYEAFAGLEVNARLSGRFCKEAEGENDCATVGSKHFELKKVDAKAGLMVGRLESTEKSKISDLGAWVCSRNQFGIQP